MSCRVLGRTIELGFSSYLISEAKRQGARYVVGEFIPTNKNILVKEFYAEAGFQHVDGSQGTDRWVMDVVTYVPPFLPWLKINP